MGIEDIMVTENPDHGTPPERGESYAQSQAQRGRRGGESTGLRRGIELCHSENVLRICEHLGSYIPPVRSKRKENEGGSATEDATMVRTESKCTDI